MTRIKICGLTRRADAGLATDLGADFLGFIFVKESRRYVTPEHVRDLLECAKGPSRRFKAAFTVGVFRNASADEINAAADVADLDFVQIHGTPPEGLTRPVIHAFTVRGAIPDTTTSADYVLFDTGGGTGRTFDWTLLESWPRTTPFFLAGGLTPDNVADAIRIARPDAIDLSSGIESAPGIKDPEKMRTLFERVNR
jgi:phosphoribosylanthranilate isomerase